MDSISELNDAREVVRILTNDDVHVYWAPGDTTLYRVSYVRTVAYGPFASLDPDNDVTVLLIAVVGDPRALIFTWPRNPDEMWNAERFVRQFGHDYAGWWSGVRPLLAALGWTDAECSSMSYDPGDVAVVGRLLTVGRDE